MIYYDLTIEQKVEFIEKELSSSNGENEERALEALNMEALFSAMKVDKHSFVEKFENGNPKIP